MKKQPRLLLLALLWCPMLMAQNHYNIQVGTFLEARKADFDAIQPLGFVYATKMPGDLYQIAIGGYETRAAAEKVWAEVRAKGYTNAFIQERSPAEGQEVAVIQLATKSAVQAVDWENYVRAGDLYAILNDRTLRIVTGVFPNVEAARQQLPAIRQMGFADAFVRTVNTIALTRITEFETGLKRSLIPLDFSQTPATPVPAVYEQTMAAKSPDMTPRNATPAPATTTTRVTPPPPAPRMRTNVKRRSALELQKVLKAEGYYKSSLDGYYGDGTAAAYKAMSENNREIQKYSLLAEHLTPSGTTTTGNALQDAINTLPNNPAAPGVIAAAKVPVAKAYQAYLSYQANGRSATVNTLMNAAIREAFVGKKFTTPPPFDYQATYAYDNLEQLLLHLQYIHSAPGNTIAAPCWLFQRHPREMQQVFERYASVATPGFLLQACDQFLSWEELSIVQAIAIDLSSDKKPDQKKIAQGASLRAMLFLAPESLDADVSRDLQTWNDKLINGLNGWATRDPLNQRTATAFKAVYFQSQARLEDFFMDKGFNENDAKSLALATLRTVVGYHLERFVS